MRTIPIRGSYNPWFCCVVIQYSFVVYCFRSSWIMERMLNCYWHHTVTEIYVTLPQKMHAFNTEKGGEILHNPFYCLCVVLSNASILEDWALDCYLFFQYCRTGCDAMIHWYYFIQTLVKYKQDVHNLYTFGSSWLLSPLHAMTAAAKKCRRSCKKLKEIWCSNEKA